MLLRASPDYGIVRVAEEKANAHNGQVVVHVHGVPAAVALVHFSVQYTHHSGDTGSADINIEDAHLRNHQMQQNDS